MSKFSGLIYLAAPIESGIEEGLDFKHGIKEALTHPPIPGLVLYDPYEPFSYDNIKSAAPVIKRVNRAVMQHSNIVVAHLAGCETWREIEYALQLPVPVWGIWPDYANPSPVAALGILVFDNIDELAQEIRAMADDAR